MGHPMDSTSTGLSCDAVARAYGGDKKGRRPYWIAESYRGESLRTIWPTSVGLSRVEAIRMIEAACPPLGFDPQWLLAKAKRSTRARLTGKQHQIMQLALFSKCDNEKTWATSYMALVEYLEAAH
jgi:hypothetical protein